MPNCNECNDTGVIDTGNNDLPCKCAAGDVALFNVVGASVLMCGAVSFCGNCKRPEASAQPLRPYDATDGHCWARFPSEMAGKLACMRVKAERVERERDTLRANYEEMTRWRDGALDEYRKATEARNEALAEAQQAKEAVLRVGRDEKWAAIYAWLNDHPDELFRAAAEASGEAERALLKERAAHEETKCALQVLRDAQEKILKQLELFCKLCEEMGGTGVAVAAIRQAMVR